MRDKTWIFAGVAAVAASATFMFLSHQQAESRLRDLHEQIDSQLLESQRVAAENARLSNMFDAGTNSRPLTGSGLAELLRLRNEYAQLRRTNAEIARLEGRNQKLRASIESTSSHIAAAQALPNYWPKNQLTFSGFADPASAMKSILAEMTKGGVENWKLACTPAAFERLEQEMNGHGATPDQQADGLKMMADSLITSCEGFHIINTIQPDAGTAVIQLSFDGQNLIRQIVLKRVDNEWKMNDLGDGKAP